MDFILTAAKWVFLVLLITALAATIGGFVRGYELTQMGVTRMTTPSENPQRVGVDTAGWAFQIMADTPVGSNVESNMLDALRLFVAFLVGAGSLMLTWKVYQYFLGGGA